MALLCVVLFNHYVTAQCIQSGPFAPTTFVNNTSAGTVAWNSPALAGLSDNMNTQASVVLSLFATANSNYLVAQGFGFNIPTAATICGISVSIERSAGGLSLGGGIEDASVRIVKNGSIMGTNHASGTAWSGSDAVANYGNSTDIWGTTWTPADINAGNFGVAIAAALEAGFASVTLSARIDHITVTVYYMNPSLLPLKPEKEKATAQATPPVNTIGFYPNPAGNTIYITGRRKTAVITIKNLEGRLIKRITVDPAVRLPQISLADIKPGTYLLETDGQIFRLQKE